MGEFLEERIPVSIRYGASYGDRYNVDITITSGGNEYRRLVNPYPTRVFEIEYRKTSANLYSQVLNIYHRAYGRFAGFRAKCLDDYTTNGLTSSPTTVDQTLTLVSTGIYQLQKTYATDVSGLSIGQPSRTIYKPVSGTVLVSVDAVTMPSTLWSVDSTTGKITFSDKTFSITGITQASEAVITLGSHTLLVGESVYISTVVGMTEINDQRGTITAKDSTTITVDIDSTLYTAYSSGGTVNSNPQPGEIVTGGCEFDIPVRFDSDLNVSQSGPDLRDLQSITLIELLNP